MKKRGRPFKNLKGELANCDDGFRVDGKRENSFRVDGKRVKIDFKELDSK